MLNFAEDITLLLLDDETGSMLQPKGLVTNHVLAGAVLMDLAFQSKIDADLSTLTVIDPTPTGDPLLDPYLAQIVASTEDLTASDWIRVLSGFGEEILEKALASLVDKGILRIDEKKILWVFGTRRYPTVDDREEREVKLRILDAILSDKIPEPRDVVVICLADAGDLFKYILSPRELDHAADRIAMISKLDLIGQALSSSVRQLHVDIQLAASSHLGHMM
ncbi:MAG: GOLPH3/VPS74 family protein [Alphaproteobacteria bacterium]